MRLVPLLLATLAVVSTTPVLAQTTAGATAEAQGRFIRALTALTLDDDSAAVRSLDAVLATTPGDPTVLTLRSEAALRLGESADAVFYARQATEAAPDRADVWRQLAASLRATGNAGDAADALATARRLAPDDLDVLLDMLDLATSQADVAAEREALLAIVRLGDTVAARLRLSVLAERAGDHDDALAQARAAARLAPSEPAVARRLADLTVEDAPPSAGADGATLLAAGRYAEAAEVLLSEIDANPRQMEAWALALRALAETRDARTPSVADDAVLLFGSVPSVLAAAAEAYAAVGRKTDAQATARRGLDALDLLGEAITDGDALRARLDAVLAR